MASRILDADGRPIDLGKLDEEIDLGGMTSLRQVWHGSVARGLTPAGLAGVLARAAEGDAEDQLTLAEEMEERDAHYAAVLSVRKRAVAGLPRVVESATDDAKHVAHADFIREVMRKPATTDLVNDLMDGIAKGYSVCAIRWKRAAQWTPLDYPHMDPRWFRYDQETGRKLLLCSNEAPNGAPLDPYQFIVHQPRIKTGLQIRNGLARLVAFAWLCKAYALKDWVAFVEVFGMPLRVGTFGPNATNEDKAILRRAVQSIGTDAGAILSESLKLDFHELGNIGSGASVYEKLCEFIDKQVSKAVLGQTGTTDAEAGGLGSGYAQVKNEIRGDIMAADAFDLEVTLNRDLVKPLIDLNFGPQEEYPRVILQITEPEDLKLLSEAIPAMVEVGMEVEESWARDKFGVPEPAAGAKLLKPRQSSTPSFTPAPALNFQRGRVALNAMLQPSADDSIDALRTAALDGWVEQIDPIVKAVQQLADSANSVDELLAALPGVLRDVAPDKLTRMLAIAAMKARGLGDVVDDPSTV